MQFRMFTLRRELITFEFCYLLPRLVCSSFCPCRSVRFIVFPATREALSRRSGTLQWPPRIHAEDTLLHTQTALLQIDTSICERRPHCQYRPCTARNEDRVPTAGRRPANRWRGITSNLVARPSLQPVCALRPNGLQVVRRIADWPRNVSVQFPRKLVYTCSLIPPASHS